MGVSVLIAEQHELTRMGLRVALEEISVISSIIEAGDGPSAVDLAMDALPDLIILDARLQCREGWDAARRILQICPRERRPRILIFSESAETYRVSSAFRYGASGFIRKDCSLNELRAAINTVLEGKTYLSPDAADCLVQGMRHIGSDLDQQQAKPGTVGRNRLTVREREVLELLALGKTSKEIAADLMITQKTVEAHRGQIMAKLELHSIAQLTKFAIREGLATLEN